MSWTKTSHLSSLFKELGHHHIVRPEGFTLPSFTSGFAVSEKASACSQLQEPFQACQPEGQSAPCWGVGSPSGGPSSCYRVADPSISHQTCRRLLVCAHHPPGTADIQGAYPLPWHWCQLGPTAFSRRCFSLCYSAVHLPRQDPDTSGFKQ